MSKAILVLDEMPEDCENCPLENKMYASCIVMCRRTSKFKGSKPGWCPLKELSGRVDNWNNYGKGWNDCLEEIEGSGEDD